LTSIEEKKISYLVGGEKMVLDKPGKLRIVTAKLGLDGHDMGVRVVSQMLRESGLEVIYLGPFQTAEKVIASCIQEDVDAVALSFLGGDHLPHVKTMVEQMKADHLNIPFIVGGVIPHEDIPRLKEMGVDEVFTAGTSSDKILAYFQDMKVTEDQNEKQER
jgi:methylmalonyl-CoA mutase C-terminal domain/subunit